MDLRWCSSTNDGLNRTKNSHNGDFRKNNSRPLNHEKKIHHSTTSRYCTLMIVLVNDWFVMMKQTNIKCLNLTITVFPTRVFLGNLGTQRVDPILFYPCALLSTNWCRRQNPAVGDLQLID
jgi:hypothetical protein